MFDNKYRCMCGMLIFSDSDCASLCSYSGIASSMFKIYVAIPSIIFYALQELWKSRVVSKVILLACLCKDIE